MGQRLASLLKEDAVELNLDRFWGSDPWFGKPALTSEEVVAVAEFVGGHKKLKKLGYVVLVVHWLRHEGVFDTCFVCSLMGHGLGAEDAKVLARAFATNTSLEEVQYVCVWWDVAMGDGLV